MRYNRTYEFLEQFLKWNFADLPPVMSDMLYGSPSVALHLWLNLSKLRIDNNISVVLFDDPFYEAHKEILYEFLKERNSDISDLPAHFVVSIQDKNFDVHFDTRGDIVEQDRKIRSIHYFQEDEISKLLSRKRLPKSLHGAMLKNLMIAMSRMGKMRDAWKPKEKGWSRFTPYHEIIASLGVTSIKNKNNKTPRK